MIIGIPQEIMHDEGRVAATPDSVAQIKAAGHEVLVEYGAGVESGISDAQFAEAGARLAAAAEIWKCSEIVMKVKEPLFNDDLGAHEADLLGEGRCLVGFLHPANNPHLLEKFEQHRLTTISMDCIPRWEEARSMDALSSMSMVAGYRAVILGAETMDRMLCAPDTDLAPLKASKVLLVGFGVVGRQSCKTAKGIGADVVVVDVRPEVEERVKSFGARWSPLPPGADQIQRVRDAIARELPDADLVVLSALVFGEKAPILVTREMLKLMKPRSVIVDVSVDQGGNCEAVVPKEIATVDGVKIVGILNLPGHLPIHSTELYARNIGNFVLHMTRNGKLDLDDRIVQAATITREGRVVHPGAKRALQAV